MVTAMFAKMLDNVQHLTQHIPEIQSCTVQSFNFAENFDVFLSTSF